MFARYAHAPNALGYCGPESAATLLGVATGQISDDVSPIARQFSGAWPYQATIAALAGVDDPLDASVTRAYWTGNAVTDDIGRVEFGRALLAAITPTAGHYWSHLNEELLAEASPTHAFHVLAVYPWSRMLGLGRPEALNVLDSCRVGWATVTAVTDDRLEVVTQHLEYESGTLALGTERAEEVDYRVDGHALIGSVVEGDRVALHWGLACDTLTVDEAATLERWTRWQLDAMAPRLAEQHESTNR